MAVKAAWVGVAVKMLMIVLISLIIASFAYVFLIGAYISCFNIKSRWSIGLVGDFNVYAVMIGAWFQYKESSWIKTVVFIVLMLTTGSVATCGYILVQFYKLSPEEFSKDPLYYVLVRRTNSSVMDDGGQMKGPSVMTLKVIFSVLGCFVLGSIVYTVITDLSQFRGEFSPCVHTFILDIYNHVVILSVWIIYKESSWISAFFWTLSHLCLGSITMCVYVVRELSRLSPQQPVSHIIFSLNSRDMQSSDPLLDENV